MSVDKGRSWEEKIWGHLTYLSLTLLYLVEELMTEVFEILTKTSLSQ